MLPFLDLTEGMKQGEFTDGMTEELIDKLSKVPGMRVPSPTSSFYFKDKDLPLSAIAHKLGVRIYPGRKRAQVRRSIKSSRTPRASRHRIRRLV